MRRRSGVVIQQADKVALIERVRDGRTYYVFPGGGIESGETPEQAAVREAAEELGLEVRLERLAAVVSFRGHLQYYFLASPVGGTFGAGTGPEYSGTYPPERGTYRPVWVSLADLPRLDARPYVLARALVSPEFGAASAPLEMVDA